MKHQAKLTVVLAVAILGIIGGLAFAVMDTPTPPLGSKPVPEATEPEGIAYHVSVGIADEYFGHVWVPGSKADKGDREKLRVSIGNAYRLIALQTADPVKAQKLRDAAGLIRLPGDPTTDSTRIKKPIDWPTARSPSCVCATFCGPDVCGAGHACGGGCSNCYLCK